MQGLKLGYVLKQARFTIINKFWKIQNFFCISGCNFIGLYNDISFVFILLVLFDVQRDLCLAKTGVVYLSFRDCIPTRCTGKLIKIF